MLITGSTYLQVVDSVTGNYVDQFTYTKPYGWQPDMSRQLATIASYANGSGYVPVPYESTGTPYAGAQLAVSLRQRVRGGAATH
jgi:hypothetical protein